MLQQVHYHKDLLIRTNAPSQDEEVEKGKKSVGCIVASNSSIAAYLTTVRTLKSNLEGPIDPETNIFGRKEDEEEKFDNIYLNSARSNIEDSENNAHLIFAVSLDGKMDITKDEMGSNVGQTATKIVFKSSPLRAGGFERNFKATHFFSLFRKKLLLVLFGLLLRVTCVHSDTFPEKTDNRSNFAERDNSSVSLNMIAYIIFFNFCVFDY